MIIGNAIAVLAYAVSVYLILRNYPRYGVFFGLFSFMHGWALVSCFYNDLGVLNIELFGFTETTLATTRLALFCLIFNLGFWLAARFLKNRALRRIDYSLAGPTPVSGNLRLLAWIGLFALIAYIGYILADGGIPLLSGMDRLSFFEQSSPLIRRLFIYGPVLGFILGYFFTRGRRVSPHLLVLLLYVFFAILTGNKFSFLLLLLTSFLLPIFARVVAFQPSFRIFTARSVRWITVAAIVLLILAFGSYHLAMGESDLAAVYLLNRILAFQGEIWWAVDSHVTTYGLFDPDHLHTEIDCIVSPQNCPEAATGLKYLMVQILGPEKAFPIIDRGYLYTMAWPAILIATFPYAWAGVIQILAGIGFCLLLYYLHFAIIYRHFIRSVIAILIVIPYLAMVLSGNFGTFFTLGMIGKFALLFVAELGVIGYRKNTPLPAKQPAPAN
jgi:hypothetical protein